MERTERKHFTREERQQILNKTGCKCAHCGMQMTTSTMTVEHIFPIYRGGTHDEYNLIALCLECNQSKGSALYNVQDYYKYILPEYKEKYMLTNAKFFSNFNGKNNKVFKLDCQTYKFIPDRYKEMIVNMVKRGTKKSKVESAAKNLMVNLKLERAYEADAERIFKFVQYIKDNKESIRYYDISMCDSEMQILNTIRFGDAYILTSGDKICGAFLFSNLKDYNIDILQLKNMEETTKLKSKYILTFAYVNKFASEVYNDIMEDIFMELISSGIIPIYFNILEKMFKDKSKFISMPYKLCNIDGTLEFFTVNGIREGIKRNLENTFKYEDVNEDSQEDIIDSFIYGKEDN